MTKQEAEQRPECDGIYVKVKMRKKGVNLCNGLTVPRLFWRKTEAGSTSTGEVGGREVPRDPALVNMTLAVPSEFDVKCKRSI